MSKIEKMLKRLCPEGVERVPFSLHSNYIRGKGNFASVDMREFKQFPILLPSLA